MNIDAELKTLRAQVNELQHVVAALSHAIEVEKERGRTFATGADVDTDIAKLSVEISAINEKMLFIENKFDHMAMLLVGFGVNLADWHATY